jgi:hypothetical protein
MTDPLIAAAQFLVTQLDWLRHATDEQGGPYAASVFAEIRDCASRMRAVVEGPADRRYLGPCGAELGPNNCPVHKQRMCLSMTEGYARCDEGECVHSDAQTCEGDVYARDGAATGRCNTCKTEYQQAERQDWIDTLRRDWLYHASEITEAYPEIKANTVSKWYSRGLLASHGEHNGGPLFKVGEVLDLAAGDKARREEIRAERDRRKAKRDEGAAA